MNKKLWFYINSGGGGVSDSDAQAFVTATGITDATQKNAINALVIGLKADSLWTTMYAIYPIVGGTATTHKYNLKDPRDLDAAFRIAFAGTITHASTGMTGNGTDGTGDTKLTPSVTMSLNDAHLSVYSRTQAQSGGNEIGVQTTTNGLSINVRFTDDKVYFRVNQNTAESVTAIDGRGFYLGSRVASGGATLYRNGSSILAGGQVSSGLATNPIDLMSFNGGFYSNCEIAFATIGTGLDATQQGNLYTRVQTFQTSLGRNV